jgi:hypothetical protein
MRVRGLLTETSPLAELLAIGDLDEGDLVLGAQGDDELLIGLLLARLVEHAHVRLSPVESLGSLTETAGKTVVHQRQLQDTLEGIKNRHLALGGIGRNLNLLLNLRNVGLFYVRLDGEKDMVSGVSSSIEKLQMPRSVDLDNIRWRVREKEFGHGRLGASPS